MHIGILGCRGIPNRYGGFEQFATYLSEELVRRGAEVSVYCSHDHPIHAEMHHGVRRIMVYDAERWAGNAGQIGYDLLCILDARKRKFDLIYQLGYTSCGLWQWLLPKDTPVISNMDGLEWSRAKYGFFARKFLKWSERQVAHRSDWMVADALPIKEYLDKTYRQPSVFLSYATPSVMESNASCLSQWQVAPRQYMLLIARMQADNHIEEAIKGVLASGIDLPLLIVGNITSNHGKALSSRYASEKIRFLGSMFDKGVLDALRTGSRWYFHGHSAGGTNPSLLEAMAASSRIIAHDNVFNRSVLGENAVYFRTPEDIASYLHSPEPMECWDDRIIHNKQKIVNEYNIATLTDKYHVFFKEVLAAKGKKSMT